MKKYNTIRVEKKEEALSMEADKINQAQQDLTYTQQQKGELTRRRNWEKRMEQKRLAALKAEEEEKEQLRTDERFMREAIRQAHKAAALGDVPIGCVIVRQGQIIARGYNRRNADKSVLSHAEIISMKKACKKLGDWRLEDCTMYVTLEPCPMSVSYTHQMCIRDRVASPSTQSGFKRTCADMMLAALRLKSS